MIVSSFTNIADFKVMVAFTTEFDGIRHRYNFKTRAWDKETQITMDKLMPVKDLIYNAGLKKKFLRKQVTSWNTIKAESVSSLEGTKLDRPYILNIGIKL